MNKLLSAIGILCLMFTLRLYHNINKIDFRPKTSDACLLLWWEVKESTQTDIWISLPSCGKDKNLKQIQWLDSYVWCCYSNLNYFLKIKILLFYKKYFVMK